ncbi:MAG: RHS repeat domain-containing protein, partial [Candidatus Omnitrophota bacterium]
FEYSDTVTSPDGVTFTYSGGELITRATYPDPDNADGSVVDYFYTVDQDEIISGTKLIDSEKSSYYDKNGTLIKVEFNNGKMIEYDNDISDDSDNGILSKVTTEDGKTYLYNRTEETVDGETVYTVRLKEIRDGEGNIFLVENNNIVEVELTDGTKLRNFTIDSNGHLVSGEIIYKDDPTFVSVLVENNMIKVINDINGNKTTYNYDEFNAAGDVIKATVNIENADHDIETYTYIKYSYGITITCGDRQWEYDHEWRVRMFTDSESTAEHYYDWPIIQSYYGSVLTLKDGTIKVYDDLAKQLGKFLPDGTIYEYYMTGDFAGNVYRSKSPDGKVAIYDYKITPEGDLAVYKRTSYDNNSNYQSYYNNDPINYSTNPTLKAAFNLDSSKSYSSAYASASYYQYNDRSVNLSLSFYNEKPSLYYYSYNYQTKQSVSDSRQLDMIINKDTDYTVEYVWTTAGINLYVYESSGTRPSTPVYTIADSHWNPKFSVSGSNAGLTLDPASSGVYRKNASVSTDYNCPLKGNPIHASEFTFDQNTSSNYLYYSIYGNTDTTYDSIYLNYTNNTSSLRVYHYDYKTQQSSNQTIPISMVFNSGKTYVIRSEIEDNILNLYIYEKGATPQGPVYTMEGASWDARIYSSINGGAMSVEAYDNLEVYKYDNDTGDVLGYIDYADKDSLTYIYNEAGEVLTKELVSGEGAKTIYDKFNRLLSETKESGEAIAYTYDNLGNIISMTPQFPDGTSFTYYDSGAFQNEIKTASLPNGKILYYDYNINDSGDLKTYKRVSYDKSNLYQSFYSNTYIPSSENPVLKASFKLDNSKTSASVYASAYYYNYNDKSVSLYMNIYSSKPTISYYYYDYVSRQTIRDSRTLDITINRDISYNVEYVWASTGVNVYIYEASGPRPASPVYTIANSNWNPRFSISGTNSALSLDPASSGGYTASKSISTDYNDPLKGGPIHTATFSLNSVAASRSLYYNVYGSTASTYDSLYFSYYNNAPTLRSYHCDYAASQ